MTAPTVEILPEGTPPTSHQPTAELLIALRENGWGVKWHHGGTAMLVHPMFGQLEIEIDPANTDQVVTFMDGMQVPHRVAMERARGEV